MMIGIAHRILVGLLAFYLGLAEPSVSYAQSSERSHLKIVILEGEGALNNIKQRTGHEPIVQVQDENRKPVAGATVIFTLPETGPSGTFANGSRVITVVTDETGRAVGAGLQPNNVIGKYQVHVEAKQGNFNATANVNETNFLGSAISATTVAAHAFPLKMVLIGVAVAGGVAGGVVAASKSGGGSSPIVISTGSSTVGTPQVSHPR